MRVSILVHSPATTSAMSVVPGDSSLGSLSSIYDDASEGNADRLHRKAAESLFESKPSMIYIYEDALDVNSFL